MLPLDAQRDDLNSEARAMLEAQAHCTFTESEVERGSAAPPSAMGVRAPPTHRSYLESKRLIELADGTLPNRMLCGDC